MKRSTLFLAGALLTAALAAGYFLPGRLAERDSTHGTADSEGFHRTGNYRIRVQPADPPLRRGDNRLRVRLQDGEGEPVADAQLRLVAQRLDADGEPVATSDVVELAATEEAGVYVGTLALDGEGAHALAVDADSEAQGHADLVLRFATGDEQLRVTTKTPEGIAYYTCSMHPSVRESEPGECPICGMDLTPVTQEEQASGTVTLSPAQRQRIGVTTAEAERRIMTRSIRAPGRVTIDERRVRSVSLKFDGYIEALDADFEGRPVARGERLLTAYSPELLSAQQEYLATRARLARRGENDSLLEAARQRLRLWDIAEAQIRALERRGAPLTALPIHAPADGIVINKRVNAGSAFAAGETLLEIADLSAVTVEAEVYEEDLPWITEGMAAEIRFPQAGGGRIAGTVDYIYPRLIDATRTARIRLVLDNPEGRLKPAMYARVDLRADLGERLAVPAEAVIFSGEQRVVFKDLGDGKLQPVPVRTGPRADGWIAIREGLEAGDTVVTSGNFLLASEARLKMGDAPW